MSAYWMWSSSIRVRMASLSSIGGSTTDGDWTPSRSDSSTRRTSAVTVGLGRARFQSWMTSASRTGTVLRLGPKHGGKRPSTRPKGPAEGAAPAKGIQSALGTDDAAATLNAEQGCAAVGAGGARAAGAVVAGLIAAIATRHA